MKDYEIKYMRLNKKLENSFKGMNLEDLTKSQVNEFVKKNLKCINRSSYYDNVRILNNILRENGSSVEVDSREMVDELVRTRENEYFTREEIIEVVDNILNFQDKFIVYALWSGIKGKTNSDLRNIKVEDIADDFTYIMINGEKFICDEYMQFLIKGCLRQKVYYKLITKANEDVFLSDDCYNLNPDSEYLIKTKPTKTTNDGTKAMSNVALNRKLAKLEEIYNDETGEELHLICGSLEKSGILYKMYLMEQDGITWDIPTIDNYFKKNGIRMNSADMYRTYYSKYHNCNRIEKKKVN